MVSINWADRLQDMTATSSIKALRPLPVRCLQCVDCARAALFPGSSGSLACEYGYRGAGRCVPRLAATSRPQTQQLQAKFAFNGADLQAAKQQEGTRAETSRGVNIEGAKRNG